MANKNGFTLIETIIGVALLAFVVVSVLGAFSQIQLNTRYVNDKNLAMLLAESKMEEILKYPGSCLSATTSIDYAYKSGNYIQIQAADPGKADQFRRTVNITATTSLMNILVTVEYANKGTVYPFRVSVNSRRGG